MNNESFDALARVLAVRPTRRVIARGLVTSLGVALSTAGFPGPGVARKKRKRRKNRKNRKKPKNNAFGCLDVGKACNGKDNKCCSSICDGNGPKKGEKDKSQCAAHDAGTCQDDQDLCPAGDRFPCGAGALSTCFRTTGNASFCGDIGKLACFDCTKDSECEAFLGTGAACVVCVGGGCSETGERICVLPGE